MRLIKLAIISAIVLFVIVLGITSLIPSHVRISRAVNMHAPQETSMGPVLKIEDWQGWNELVKGIPPSKIQYRIQQLNTDSLSIKITHATADTIKTVWKSQSGREIAGVFTFQRAGEVTIVQWYFDFHQRWYPWEKFASINFDKQWGPLMEKSLDNLKNIVERL
jgi:hypothetical protein